MKTAWMPSRAWLLALLVAFVAVTCAFGEPGRPWQGQMPPRGMLRPASHQEADAPTRKLPQPGGRGQSQSTPSSSGPLVTTFASLAVVLGLFFLVMWLMRRHLPGGSAKLPEDVLEVLGRGMIGPKQPVQLVRLGDRLLLLAANSAGMETLCEITDTDEVTRLAGLCRQAHPASATTAFRQVFGQLSAPSRSSPEEDRHG